MLPSRSRLQSWNPDSLSPAAKAIGDGGQSVYNAVSGLEDKIDRMPEAGAWEGKSHTAATGMFGRATHQASQFEHYVDAEAAALNKGESTIGAARHWLLRHADDIDAGELHVTDAWVVLIKPARMSAQKAAQLQQEAEKEQAEINRLLLAVGDADDATAAAMFAAGKDAGFTLPGPSDMSSLFPQGPSRPADEVPNPRTMQGLAQQGTIRGEDMAVTVRESSEKTTEDGQHITTLMMQDGSKHVITNWGSFTPKVGDAYYDKTGKLVSDTTSFTDLDGVKKTLISWGDQTTFAISETPDGTRTAGWILPDGRHGVLPPDNPLLTGRVPEVLGGALTAVDAHVERGGRIPMLTPESVKNVGAAARYAGPALGITATMYDALAAETAHDACVAGVSGVFGVAGDYAGGKAGFELGAAAGAAVPIPGAEVVTIPLGAAVGGLGGGKGLSWIGSKVGEAFCPH